VIGIDIRHGHASLDWLHVYPLLLLATYPAMYLATVVILRYGDLTLYALYSFHFNAFVWNGISTPDGMASNTVLVVTGDHDEAFMAHGRQATTTDLAPTSMNTAFLPLQPCDAKSTSGELASRYSTQW
jgi:hypothetical protein